MRETMQTIPALQSQREGKRCFELDFAKALAVVFMIFVHARMLWGNHGVPSAIGFAIDFAGTPLCAPVFMICMGAGWIFTRHTAPGDFFRRGLALLALGYLLNLARLTIPLALIGGFPGGFSVLTPVNSFFAADILQFAGLAFLFMALVKKMHVSDAALLGITILSSTLGGVLNGRLLTGVEPLASLQGLFVYAGLTTAFPFFSWIVYPVAGYFFAKHLTACENRTRFYGAVGGWALLAGLAVFLTGKHYGLTFASYFGENTYYGQTPFSTLGVLSVAFFWMALLYFATFVLQREMFRKTILRWSRNVLPIYLCQWIVMDWGAIVLHRLEISLPPTDATTISIAAGVLIVSDLIGCGYRAAMLRLKPGTSPIIDRIDIQ